MEAMLPPPLSALISMVIFFAIGRLGNQLFQYSALRNLPQGDPIVAFGMESLFRYFDGHHLADNSAMIRLMRRILHQMGPQRIETLVRSTRLLTLAEEKIDAGSVSFAITPGILKRVSFVPTNFFQAENMVSEKAIGTLMLKKNILERAAAKVDRLGRQRRELMFVHIRHGDYATFPSIDHSAILPLAWYQKQMEWMRKRNPHVFFVIVSDSRPTVEKIFSGQEGVWVSDADEAIIDFGMMTLCGGGGIMSASSFSWWGGYFSRRENPAARFLAPELWFGVRQGKWDPPQIKTSWIEYRPAEI